MDIEQAKNRCNELVKVEHANWIGISNQEAIQALLNELDKDNNIISDLQNEVTLKQCELDNKDKIINEMAEQLAGYAIFDVDIEEPTILGDKQEVIDYFTKKVGEK